MTVAAALIAAVAAPTFTPPTALAAPPILENAAIPPRRIALKTTVDFIFIVISPPIKTGKTSKAQDQKQNNEVENTITSSKVSYCQTRRAKHHGLNYKEGSRYGRIGLNVCMYS